MGMAFSNANYQYTNTNHFEILFWDFVLRFCFEILLVSSRENQDSCLNFEGDLWITSFYQNKDLKTSHFNDFLPKSDYSHGSGLENNQKEKEPYADYFDVNRTGEKKTLVDYLEKDHTRDKESLIHKEPLADYFEEDHIRHKEPLVDYLKKDHSKDKDPIIHKEPLADYFEEDHIRHKEPLVDYLEDGYLRPRSSSKSRKWYLRLPVLRKYIACPKIQWWY